MKKYNKIIVSLIFILTFITACSDSFLEEKVLDAYAPSTLNNKLGYDAAVVGIYNHFSTFLSTTNDQTILGMFQLGTDIVWNPMGRSNGNARPYHDYPTLTSRDLAAQRLWTYLYRLISNANIMIKNAEGGVPSDMTAAEVNAYNGEAKFFRAYAYNMLGTLYGGVPLVTEPISSPKTDLVRAPIDEVNNLVVADLLYAINVLPEVSKAPTGRINKSSARHLLAEVYLRTGQNSLAEKQCDTIINLGGFNLITARYGNTSAPGTPFSDMFLKGKQRFSQGNKEAIWVLEMENPTDFPGGSTDNPQERRIWGAGYHDIPGMQPCDSLGGRGLTRMRLDNYVLYGLYPPGDMRNSQYSIHRQHYFNDPAAKYSTVYGQPVPYGQTVSFDLSDGTKLNINALDTVYKLAPYTLKWGYFDPRDVFGYGMWKDFILMRLGETYLFRAEARFKQGNMQGAADDINVLRTRAQAPQVTSGQINLDFILDERIRELIGEENRRMTLVRTGTLIDRVTRINGVASFANGNMEGSNNIQPYNALLPIPQSEIDLNKDATLTQNPGYN